MISEALRERFRAEAARGKMDVDLPVYEAAGKDPLEPVLLGNGSLTARIGIFGRDPGRTEIQLGEPFIGAGGRLVRDELHRAAHGVPAPDQAAAIAVGARVFWGNTVPYKPLGNKAWSVPVKRRFLPMIRDHLLSWTGGDLITLGNEAFHWFGLAEPGQAEALERFWTLPDRYEQSLEVKLVDKRLTLHPLPHPSPLNATWYKRFPGLLAARLSALGWKG